MVINANTKIGALIRANKNALDAIISISPRFDKLKNPVLRKIVAARTSIAAAAKIGGCQVGDFFNVLKPLGFEIDESLSVEKTNPGNRPGYLARMEPSQVSELDVRPILAKGEDPLALIMQKIKWLKPNQALKIINSFYPEPLVNLLRKQGYETWYEEINPDHFETWFFRKESSAIANAPVATSSESDWDSLIADFGDKIKTIDVRHLPMPKPMMTILESLSTLPEGYVLFVHHKRIPVYLLPELKDRQFSYSLREIDTGEVQMLIYRQNHG